MKGAGERVILAIHPSTRGFGFALFVGSNSLVDWGAKEIRYKDKNFLTLHMVKALVERYSPDLIVMEDGAVKEARRHERIVILYRLIERYADEKKIKVRRFAKGKVHAHFGAETRHAAAEAVARAIPMLAPRLPRKRKPWQTEDLRQSLFDAVALGLVYFAGLQ